MRTIFDVWSQLKYDAEIGVATIGTESFIDVTSVYHSFNLVCQVDGESLKRGLVLVLDDDWGTCFKWVFVQLREIHSKRRLQKQLKTKCLRQSSFFKKNKRPSMKQIYVITTTKSNAAKKIVFIYSIGNLDMKWHVWNPSNNLYDSCWFFIIIAFNRMFSFWIADKLVISSIQCWFPSLNGVWNVWL